MQMGESLGIGVYEEYTKNILVLTGFIYRLKSDIRQVVLHHALSQ